MIDEKKPEGCGKCVRPVAKDAHDRWTCALAEMDLCFKMFCSKCRQAIEHTCGWVAPKEITGALERYLLTYKDPGPTEIHGELLAAGIISDSVEVRKDRKNDKTIWIGIFFLKSKALVFKIVWNPSWKGVPFGNWVPLRAWYELKRAELPLDLRPNRVPPAVVRFWTGMEPLAWGV